MTRITRICDFHQPVWLIAGLLCWTIAGTAQFPAGTWTGRVFQPGKANGFTYQVTLEPKGEYWFGEALAKAETGQAQARFEVSATWNGAEFAIQELRQLEPATPQWCLKFAVLRATETGLWAGTWRADNCTPGQIELTYQGRGSPLPPQTFTWIGRWAGQLNQSDRNYGFYFSLDLQPGGVGESYIVSEDNGGSAHLSLVWEVRDSTLYLRESAVVTKTDPRWPWCVKNMQLQLQHNGNLFTLNGPWEGTIEGRSGRSGRCAPGTIYLERPILTPPVQQLIEAYQPYRDSTGREVHIARTIEVASSNLVIYIWDNGTEDGDVVTLFLNGRRLANKMRVRKRRAAVSVKLERDDNYLILHADDLGSITPNTVAVAIDDGQREQVLILSADLAESGAVLIRRFRLK